MEKLCMLVLRKSLFKVKRIKISNAFSGTFILQLYKSNYILDGISGMRPFSL